MKQIKTKLSLNFSILIISILICSSSSGYITQALQEENGNQFSVNSIIKDNWRWNPIEVISTESTNNSGESSLIADSNGNLHVVWKDYTELSGSGPDCDIYYKRKGASSSSWTTTQVVSTESTLESHNPSLAVDLSGNVHVVWEDYTELSGNGPDKDIFYKRWNSSSSSWTTTEVISTVGISSSSDPSVAVDFAGDVHIAYVDGSIYADSGIELDIFYRNWDSSTTIWSTTEIVSTESTGGSTYPSITTDSVGNVHVAWVDVTDYDGSEYDEDIFYKSKNSLTSLWSSTEVVSMEGTEYSGRPTLKVDFEGNVHVAWTDISDFCSAGSDYDIFYKRRDFDIGWSIAQVVSTESTEHSNYHSLDVDSTGDVSIAWSDQTEYQGSDTDIFCKYLDSSSSSWSMTEVVSTNCVNNSAGSSLAVDNSGYIHIAWTDLTDYDGAGPDSDIFYRKLSGPPVDPELSIILPNPTEYSSVSLDWNDVSGATSYFVYRSTSYIWSVENLIPIVSVSFSNYDDSLTSEGLFYYVIVAKNSIGNSSISNCQFVEYIIPHVREFGIISSLILGLFVFSLILTKNRNKKPKLN